MASARLALSKLQTSLAMPPPKILPFEQGLIESTNESNFLKINGYVATLFQFSTSERKVDFMVRVGRVTGMTNRPQ